jgi:two-component system sensor histidine kinase/response regulator
LTKPHEEPACADPIPEVEGLDTLTGLARLGGNRRLYLKLLRQSSDFETAPAEITKALSSGDWAEAERLAHTVKGVAATLGAGPVEKSAHRLEQALRARASSEALTPLLAELEASLRSLMTGLRAALPPQGASLPGLAVDPGTAGSLVAQMLSLLGEFDVAAAELFDSHLDHFAAILGPAASSVLQKQIGNFAFAEAHETLGRAAAAKGTPRP